MQVKNYDELKEALHSEKEIIELVTSIGAADTITLKPGQKLLARKSNILLSFINSDGIVLTGNNEVSGLSIQTSPQQRAIYIDSDREDLGTLTLNDLTVTGMIQLVTRGRNKTLNVNIDGLDIVSADARNYPERPMNYGVNVYQGALTIYNYNPNEGSSVTVSARNISLGRENAPVIGTGVFISGFNKDSGPVVVNELTTQDIYTNGMIPSGQPNLITGAIFILDGVHAKNIVSHGVVTTYGTNDMVLDVWGTVDTWIAKQKVTSYGASGIGFVNFGTVHHFIAEDDVETYGLGARGFNQYDGTIDNAEFKKIVTAGDGSIGMQFSKPVGTINIKEGIVTHGSTGETLVKGVIRELQADAISVLEGGNIENLIIGGDIVVHGEGVVGYHVDGGEVKTLRLDGKISVGNPKSQAVVIENSGESDLRDLKEYL